MRYAPLLIAAALAGGMAWAEPAGAAQLPAQSARWFGSAPAMVEPAGYWRRYCRFHDCTGPDVVVVQPDTPPAAVADNPPVVAIVPVRPVSCGEFHYWNGSARADGRPFLYGVIAGGGSCRIRGSWMPGSRPGMTTPRIRAASRRSPAHAAAHADPRP